MRIVLFWIYLFTTGIVFSQTFTNSSNVSVPNLSTRTSSITVTGVGNIDCNYGLEQVCLSISHTRDRDMDIFLIDPSGDRYELTTDNGGTGNNFTGTCFIMTAATSITAGSAPFSSSFVPEGDIGLANNGQNANGVWTLEITDDQGGQAGTLTSWSLVFAATPACNDIIFETTPGTATSTGTNTSTQTVSGVGDIDCSFGLKSVCVDITHTWDSDLRLFIQGPSGAFYALSLNNGGDLDDYSTTCFDMSATATISSGSPPYNGSFVPEGNISLLNNQNANGVWTLFVLDDAGGDDGIINSWKLTFGDNPECPTPTTEDCEGGTIICTDETFTGNSSGFGRINDLNVGNDGCLAGEHESAWYVFAAETDGTFAFQIRTSVDYDFAIWGPFASAACSTLGSPLRCSYAGSVGNTGLASTSFDTSENDGGDRFVSPISATAGDVFIVLVDNFTADGSSFDWVWTLTSGATLDCTPLPIEFNWFTGTVEDNVNLLEWQSLSETNNSHFTLERSTDGINWEAITTIDGAGNSSHFLDYQYRDFDFELAINYYRLSQTDFDGTTKVLDVISIDNKYGGDKVLYKIFNLMGQEVNDAYTGVKIYLYTDGTTRKIVSR